ncbi:MAG: putative sugar O-methyltransferase [Elusimicrobia bacterium]|nr:putative sugar O-methyltransferase [Elusimicrobiota bacterium]
MHDYPELTRAREDMQKQVAFYRPTAFWEEPASNITSELHTHGIEKFRSLEHPLGYFVPTYGVPASGFTAEQAAGLLAWLGTLFPQATKPQLALAQFLGGEMSALADYRVLAAADDPRARPFLHTFSESTFGSPVEHFQFNGRRFSRSSLNYLLGLSLLKKHLHGDVPRTVLEIGGGFGSLGEVLSNAGIEGLRYIDVDIPPTSFVAQRYLSEVLGEEKVATYAQTCGRDSIAIDSLPQAAVLCAWQLEKLNGAVDLFVNFVSFQEMEPDIVRNYFSHVTRLGARWVLLRNLREGKQQRKDGGLGVDTPIRSSDYLSMLPGYDLVERNVIPFGYRTVDGFHSEILLLKRHS